MQNLLLLHGAIGSKMQLEPLADILSKDYRVYTLNFSGHGGEKFPDYPFSIELFAGEVLNFLSQNKIGKTSIFGYSMGGYVGMYIARYYPEHLYKLVTLATKFNWTEEIAAKEIKMMQPEIIELKVPLFSATLKDRHAPQDWKEVLLETAGMMKKLGLNNALKDIDYQSIINECFIISGDKDKMVSMEETINIYRMLPNAQLAILPNTTHPIEQVEFDMVAYLIRKFIE
jgi:pimeloyl-ACP methyl ester carboxylesterase